MAIGVIGVKTIVVAGGRRAGARGANTRGYRRELHHRKNRAKRRGRSAAPESQKPTNARGVCGRPDAASRKAPTMAANN